MHTCAPSKWHCRSQLPTGMSSSRSMAPRPAPRRRWSCCKPSTRWQSAPSPRTTCSSCWRATESCWRRPKATSCSTPAAPTCAGVPPRKACICRTSPPTTSPSALARRARARPIWRWPARWMRWNAAACSASYSRALQWRPGNAWAFCLAIWRKRWTPICARYMTRSMS
ncbi:hypothetical protein D3C71_1627810 [compost metagenome]